MTTQQRGPGGPGGLGDLEDLLHALAERTEVGPPPTTAMRARVRRARRRRTGAWLAAAVVAVGGVVVGIGLPGAESDHAPAVTTLAAEAAGSWEVVAANPRVTQDASADSLDYAEAQEHFFSADAPQELVELENGEEVEIPLSGPHDSDEAGVEDLSGEVPASGQHRASPTPPLTIELADDHLRLTSACGTVEAPVTWGPEADALRVGAPSPEPPSTEPPGPCVAGIVGLLAEVRTATVRDGTLTLADADGTPVLVLGR